MINVPQTSTFGDISCHGVSREVTFGGFAGVVPAVA